MINEISGSELALESTLRKNFENFRLLKVVEWGRLIAQNNPLAMLIPKMYIRINRMATLWRQRAAKTLNNDTFFLNKEKFFLEIGSPKSY